MPLSVLLLNATLGSSWADPLAGLVIAAVAVKEGREAWRGEGCCGPLGTAHTDEAGTGGCADGCCVPAETPGAGPQSIRIEGLGDR